MGYFRVSFVEASSDIIQGKFEFHMCHTEEKFFELRLLVSFFLECRLPELWPVQHFSLGKE